MNSTTRVNFYSVVAKNEEDEIKIKNVLTDYVTAAISLNVLDSKLKKINEEKNEIDEKFQKQQIAYDIQLQELHIRAIEATRKIVLKYLPSVLSTNQETIVSTIPNGEIDKIVCLKEKQCLGIDDEGMERVILTFVRMHKTERLNLTVFKDEFRGTSLIRLFNEIPKTNVKTVIIAKQLNDQELQWKTWLESSLADRNFTIVVKS